MDGDLTADTARDPDLARDPVVDAFKQHVDRTLIREQLRRSIDERVTNMIAALRFAERLRDARQQRGT